MKEDEEELISADTDGLLKGDGEPGGAGGGERPSHNGSTMETLLPPNASHLPSLGFSSHRRPCQATTWARLVQQSRNKTTPKNTNWGVCVCVGGEGRGGKQLTLSFYQQTSSGLNPPPTVWGGGETLTPTRPFLRLSNCTPTCLSTGDAARRSVAASWFTAGDQEAFR